MDVFISLVSIILFFPLLVLVAAMVKFDSSGQVFFRQQRYGLDGKEFTLFKFRSMTADACEDINTSQVQQGDIRVTRLGRILRKYSIDELPQLYNVLIGDMSIVGPRPHANHDNEFYRDKIQGYMFRYSTKPGITGLAQVNGYRGETPEIDDMKNRIDYDIKYIKNWSLISDIRIILKTITVVVSAKNAY